MNSKKGFSFIAFLVYIMLFSGIAVFITTIITSLLLPALSATQAHKSLINLHVASDIFVRDIKALKINDYSWKKIMHNELIWGNDTYAIGWLYHKNRLERREGSFDGKKWNNTKKSVVASSIKEGDFKVEKHKESIIGIELTLVACQWPQKPVITYVAVNQQKKGSDEQ